MYQQQTIASVSNVPDPFFEPSNDQERRNWFKDNILYVGSYYDRKTYFPTEDTSTLEYPSERIEKYFRYAMGRQPLPVAYKQTAVDNLNAPIRTIWINGQELATIVGTLNDIGKQTINNFKVTVKATSKETQNETTRMIEAARTKMLLKEEFKQFADMGINYEPIGKKDEEFHNVEEMEMWAEKDYQEESAKWGQLIANDIFTRNRLKVKAATALLHTHITGRTGMHVYTYNGRVIVDYILPQQLIWDVGDGNDPFNREARFAGFVEYIDKSAVLARYSSQLSDKEIAEIKSADSSTIQNSTFNYQRINGFINNTYGFKYSKITVYWKGRRTLGWKDGTEDKWGHKPYYKVKKDENGKPMEKGELYDECIYQGTLIGNNYLVDIGVAPNQVKDPYNPAESDLPIKVFTPNIMLGETNSVVSKLHQIQDFIDYYTNEIKKVVARNLGKNIVLYSDAFEGPSMPAEMVADFEQFGITYLNRKKGEPGNSEMKDRDTHTVVDMTLDQNIIRLAELRREQHAIMQGIVNVTPILTGSQKQYVSSSTQQTSLAQSGISTVSVMMDFVEHIESVLTYATNVGKIVHSLEDGKKIPVAGDRGKTFLQETTKFSNEDLGAQIRVLDIIDEKGKERLLSIALGLVQAGLFTMMDYVMVEQSATYTDALQYFRMIAKRQERDKAAAQKFALAQQQIEATRQDQATRTSVGAKLQEAEMNNQTKLAAEKMKTDTTKEVAGLQAGVQIGQASRQAAIV